MSHSESALQSSYVRLCNMLVFSFSPDNEPQTALGVSAPDPEMLYGGSTSGGQWPFPGRLG